MRWRGRRQSTNVEDRRGASVGRRGVAAGGCGTLVVVLVVSWLTGANPLDLLQLLGDGGGVGPVAVDSSPGLPGAAAGSPHEEELAQFAAVVLADTEETWSRILAEHGHDYPHPTLVLFRDAVDSACGYNSAAVGPFYCPADARLYLDLGFLDDLGQRFGAPGDFAQAYVIAHEVGHHLQNVLGINGHVQERQQRARSQQEVNDLSVRLELQADCFAGVWGNRAHGERQLLEPGDVEEGLAAAAAIGDDRLQRASTGRVVPESWTHGSAEMRARWLRRGLEGGDRAAWFRGQPTIQARAWPGIAAGEHVLVTAPTGSGKTLAAFLWALDRLLTGAWERRRAAGALRLAAEGAQHRHRRNLTGALGRARGAASPRRGPPPEVRSRTRTGDTPPTSGSACSGAPPRSSSPRRRASTSCSPRRRPGCSAACDGDPRRDPRGRAEQARRPPDHRRRAPGRLAGEVQRIALSATVRPLERVARWVGGFVLPGDPAAPAQTPAGAVVPRRPPPARAGGATPGRRGGDAGAEGPTASGRPSVAELHRSLGRNRSTLVFANSRRMVEKLTRLVNETPAPSPTPTTARSPARCARGRGAAQGRRAAGHRRDQLARAGHRHRRPRRGGAGADAASAPSAVQRIGRAGHAVGEVSRAGGSSRSSARPPRRRGGRRRRARRRHRGDRPGRAPLDVLAQVLLSMTAAEPWRVDELYERFCTADPYRDLPRRHFDLVLDMLAGRYADARVRELRRGCRDRPVDGTVRARPGAERLSTWRAARSPTAATSTSGSRLAARVLGELDEEFVWERSVGDTLHPRRADLADRAHHPQRRAGVPGVARALGDGAVLARRRARPFELRGRAHRPCSRSSSRGSVTTAWAPTSRTRHRLTPAAAAALLRHLRDQRAPPAPAPPTPDPRRAHRDPQQGAARRQVVLHTLWGGRVNRPFALALAGGVAGALRPAPRGRPRRRLRGGGPTPPRFSADDPFALVRISPRRAAARRTRGHRLLRRALPRGRGLRAAAAPRGASPPHAAVAVAPARQGAARGGERLRGLPARARGLADLPAGRVRPGGLRRASTSSPTAGSRCATSAPKTPSPFTAQVAWKQTNELMYADDVPTVRAGARPDLVREMALASHLRPRIDPALAADLGARLQRLAPGWAPRDADDLLEWVKERLLIPADEWPWQQGLVERRPGPRRCAAARGLFGLPGRGRSVGARDPAGAARPLPAGLARRDSIAETDLGWLGVGRERIAWALAADRELAARRARLGARRERRARPSIRSRPSCCARLAASARRPRAGRARAAADRRARPPRSSDASLERWSWARPRPPRRRCARCGRRIARRLPRRRAAGAAEPPRAPPPSGNAAHERLPPLAGDAHARRPLAGPSCHGSLRAPARRSDPLRAEQRHRERVRLARRPLRRPRPGAAGERSCRRSSWGAPGAHRSGRSS
jgi:uncharacterized protein